MKSNSSGNPLIPSKWSGQKNEPSKKASDHFDTTVMVCSIKLIWGFDNTLLL